MKQLISALMLLLLAISSLHSQQTYSEKASERRSDDYNYCSTEYSYQMNAKGGLIGTNVFSVVYQPTVCPIGKYGYSHYQQMKTGKESMTIIVDPNNRGNRTYKYSNTIVHWYYDARSKKWVKRFNDVMYGLYTLVLRDYKITGIFTIPVGPMIQSLNSPTLIKGAVGKTIEVGYKKDGVFTRYDDLPVVKNIGNSEIDFAGYLESFVKDGVDIKSFYFWKNVINLNFEDESFTGVPILFPASYMPITGYLYPVHKGPLAKDDLQNHLYVGIPDVKFDGF
ncbi:hypothetical protein [Dysgonomonas sp. 520]|uniref:hypothetical protein n=1 Tax=Dysgonomonas sp. 520 TaxID=2302931 RepID=UPI0013D7FA77|nr:hypothetical protein [Dysgonomonas sp. 520]NDW11216.1 hypothetical protein [Dysgonomonas sp. 520]